MYSIFYFFEYTLVLSNMAYHFDITINIIAIITITIITLITIITNIMFRHVLDILLLWVHSGALQHGLPFYFLLGLSPRWGKYIIIVRRFFVIWQIFLCFSCDWPKDGAWFAHRCTLWMKTSTITTKYKFLKLSCQTLLFRLGSTDRRDSSDFGSGTSLLSLSGQQIFAYNCDICSHFCRVVASLVIVGGCYLWYLLLFILSRRSDMAPLFWGNAEKAK